MNTETQIINICGGPGVGKSTIATGIYSKLKQKGIDCELASEYAKDITWEGNHDLLNNQIHLFAEQYRRQYRLLDKVDYVICDSPLILNAIYLDFFLERADKKFFDSEYIYLQKQFFNETFAQFNNLNFYVTRLNKYYTPIGRVHDLDESKEIDKKIAASLLIYDPNHFVCSGSTGDVIDEIVRVTLDGFENV